ncbi:hypothetical protein GCM10027033_13760 [Leucobacter ruminantium]
MQPVGLSFRSSSLTAVNLDPGDCRWIDVLRYSIARGGDDREILRALIATPGYAHSYARPRLNPTREESEDIHGPYRRTHIRESHYRRIDSAAAREELHDWIFDPDALSPADAPPTPTPDNRVLAEMIATSQPITTDDVVHLSPDVPPILEWILDDSRRLYRLDDLREIAEHDWGWVVGALGYIEIASISADGSEVALLVASDD